MTVYERLFEALNPIAPSYVDVYRGDELEYIVFSCLESPRGIGEGMPTDYVCAAIVNYYAPAGASVLGKKERIKTALVEAGFTWPYVTPASDKSGQRYIFECEGLMRWQA